MKKQIKQKLLIILLLILQLLQLVGGLIPVQASIQEGDTILLQADHECDSLVEYWMEKEQKWSYKVVWYVYYYDQIENKKYPAFCVEPAKDGVGTGYTSYDTTAQKEEDNRIWRILNKGYMGSSYQDWQLVCDDDLYTATKIALHCLKDGSTPNTKYILGTRSVDGNTVEEIQTRGKRALEVAQELYEYGINGTETYVKGQVTVAKQGTEKIKKLQNTSYYIQNYQVNANKSLKSYEVSLQNFPTGTKILNSNNQEQTSFTQNSFQIAIPINQIKNDINGTIFIQNAEVKTNPIFYCKSSIPVAQSYVTYVSGYEKTNAQTTLEIKANQCSLQIQKIDKETKEPVPNVTFEIKDEKQNKIAEVTTNQKGIAKLENINPQMITVKEIRVPENYVLSQEEKQVKLEWGKVATLTFENELIKGQIKIVKISKEDNVRNGQKKGSPIPNVLFEIRDAEGNLVEELTTNQEGVAFSRKLPKGVYTIKEIQTDENYLLTEEEFTIEIKEHGKIEEIIITNIPKEPEKPKLPRTGF